MKNHMENATPLTAARLLRHAEQDRRPKRWARTLLAGTLTAIVITAAVFLTVPQTALVLTAAGFTMWAGKDI